MLERNKRIKPTPERFQDACEEFDVIFTVEERIYDAVLEGVCPYYLKGNYSRWLIRFTALYNTLCVQI